ncbi:MAG: hypothetical protein A2289_15660 [Deltaproteobacteria bacterium RIFOXYA12_FULL_58_15]|nr:MAG: hypothetical protein A2289_15660 [Deltaproteobacteria bacterium RIFOXYA12_FULL_58_15]OGR15366.1 MAG: hypothetical protein A2341_00160 [Deltaproteobacteria bacterium RIFOXYB12_FULL_58_9]
MSWSAFAIGSRFRIIPEGAPRSFDGRIDLVLERGAFGSGEHETTASCLETLGRLGDLHGLDVLDFGSGTGVLAVAALLRHARSAVLVDINADAITTGIRNCELNSVTESATHVVGSMGDVPPRQFELVMANIYGDILLDVAVDLVGRVSPGGHLILSGILWQDNFPVRKKYESLGCELVKNTMLDEYSTLWWRAPGA